MSRYDNNYYRETLFRTRYGYWRSWVIFTFWPAVICVLVAAIAVGGYALSVHQTSVSCHNYELNNGIPTKFVEYNAWWDVGCVGKINGHWIPTQNISGVNGFSK